MRVLVEQTVRRTRSELEASGERDIVVHELMGGSTTRAWTLQPEHDAVIVGTLDQLVSRALMRGYGVSRYAWPVHFGLLHNDALWVFDEVQLMGEALATSVQLDGFRSTFPPGVGPVQSVWMSATVEPAWLATVNRPAPTAVLRPTEADRAHGLGRRLAASKIVEGVPGLDAALVADRHRAGTLTLVVLNTVKTARELYLRLARLRGVEAEVVLLHSRFRPGDRRANVERLDAPLDPTGPGRIVVATQVVEAGVDVSAATLVTEAAPWASLVQRFGRCNRQGEIEDARILWAAPARPAPYEQDEIDQAIETLTRLEGRSASPDALDELDAPLTMPPRRFVIRRRDFVGLFDTAPDLSGLDLDIQRFVRDGDDLTVSFAWRSLGGEPPVDDTTIPDHEELCQASIGEARKAIDDRKRVSTAWRYDVLDGRWTAILGRDLRPGDQLLVDASFGCYQPGTGFDPSSKATVEPVSTEGGEQPEAVDADRERGAWTSIAEHTDGVIEALEGLVESLGDCLEEAEVAALRTAARYHDLGKAHAVFQAAMHAGDEVPARAAEALLAKRVGRAPRYARRGFRHELASLLAYLASESPDPLAAYLIASHHGRVRLGARPLPVETRPPDGRAFVLGCWEGDVLPEVDLGGGVATPSTTLDLRALELGSEDGDTYTDVALGLLDRLGPYRLAFLETILRTADVRRSAEEEDGHA
jgi:CRISPR-associated endonuclease/helicase Cas3